MKKLLILITLLFSFGYMQAQTSFRQESDVMSYMDGKKFYNSGSGLTVEYGYISSYNTYGIKVSNNSGSKFYFINVDITPSGSFADLYGMSAEDGRKFGFRLYNGKLIVGRGEEGEQTFYLK